MDVAFSPAFLRRFKKLDARLQDEAIEKIELFKDLENHGFLKVHKLNGPFSDCHSFSVNHKTRIIFEYLDRSKGEVVLHAIGDHEIYD
jgi:mRNA-degrading endonuclease YafQ of YafQ-DinJ toxin-antitoxin module